MAVPFTMFRRFAQEAASYAVTMRDVLAFQFPKAAPEARNLFFIQLSLFNNALYQLGELSPNQLSSMVEAGVYDHIPSSRDIYIATLMTLSADLG